MQDYEEINPDFGSVNTIISITNVRGDKDKSNLHVGVCRPRVSNLRPTLLDATVRYYQLINCFEWQVQDQESFFFK